MTFGQRIKIIFSSMWDFVSPFFIMLLKQGGTALLQSASVAVRRVETDLQGASGEEKRKAAFDIVKSEMQSRGEQVATSVINAAIEVAVQKLKNL
jgi:hypothetical protein